MVDAVNGHVEQLWRYPVKSAQGRAVDSIGIAPSGVVGDRQFALLDANGKLCSAKRYSKLFDATGNDDGSLTVGDRALHDDAAISEWLGHNVRKIERRDDVQVGYEMTFDPPNDDAEYFEIPAPPGAFVDLAAIHLIARATLDHCAAQRPDLDWDVRRFRPNVVVDADIEPFGEDAWAGRDVAIGDAVVRVDLPTVRCAMPLRAQPGGLTRQPELYHALEELHANHLGVYCSVVTPGTVALGDSVGLG
jgi:uncharacterized protein